MWKSVHIRRMAVCQDGTEDNAVVSIETCQYVQVVFVSTRKYKRLDSSGYVTNALSHVALIPTICVGVIIIVPGMLVRGSQYTDCRRVTLPIFIDLLIFKLCLGDLCYQVQCECDHDNTEVQTQYGCCTLDGERGHEPDEREG